MRKACGGFCNKLKKNELDYVTKLLRIESCADQNDNRQVQVSSTEILIE